MKNVGKIAILLLLAGAVAVTLAARGRRGQGPVAPTAGASSLAMAPGTAAPAAPVVAAPARAGPGAGAPIARPRLLECGSMRCQACLQMAKVLEALRASQGERLQVDFLDVFEQPAEAERHRITIIPTQILYDAGGREIFRHVGYLSHDDILAKFRELGVDL